MHDFMFVTFNITTLRFWIFNPNESDVLLTVQLVKRSVSMNMVMISSLGTSRLVYELEWIDISEVFSRFFFFKNFTQLSSSCPKSFSHSCHLSPSLSLCLSLGLTQLFLEALLSRPGYLWHSAHTPGSFAMSYTKTLFQINSYESVYGLARLHTTYITIN